MLPDARIIHEMVVGGCRADLAAVSPERVVLVEIKSEKDTLRRLPMQLKAFRRAAHEVIVVAHEKWFDRTPYNTGQPRCVPGAEIADIVNAQCDVWMYPEPPAPTHIVNGGWHRSRSWSPQLEPRASELLLLLWRAELLAEADRHRVCTSRGATVMHIVREMSWHMTGREIAQAVCRQLRRRPFPEADPAILTSLTPEQI